MLRSIDTSHLDVELKAAVARTDDDGLASKGAQGFEDGLAELLQNWNELRWTGVVYAVGLSCCRTFKFWYVATCMLINYEFTVL